jgi:uncharacterized LabA/DUF88 family protein
MMFVDGENLAIRWKDQIRNEEPPNYIAYEKDIYVWSEGFNLINCGHDIIRKYYYTSAPGDIDNRNRIFDKLKSLGIEAPYVFPRKKKGRSKRVDITLSVEMLFHAYQRNYEVAILVAGDEDYVPLVEAVKNVGRRVFVWFFQSGLSPALKRSADYYCDISQYLCEFPGKEFISPDREPFSLNKTEW